jgi:CBS domain-containing protein
MMDSDTKKPAEAQEQNRATARIAAQRGAAALEQTAQASGEALRQAGDSGAELVRRGSDASAAMMRHLSDTAGETMRKGGQARAEGQRNLLQGVAEQFEQTAYKVSQAVQGTAQDMRIFMELPTTAGRGLQDFQRGVGSLVEGTVRTNLRATTELLRLTNPAAVIELQQRFVREWLDTLLQGSVALIRASREAADQTLRPLEQQVEQRRHSNGGSRRERVTEAMTREVRVANPEDTVQQVVRLMQEEDIGALPVGEGDRLVGMVTDRDVALRVVAEGRDPARTKVREVMTADVRYVFEDEDLSQVADNMAEQQVRRLPVVNRDKRLVGVLSLGDLTNATGPQFAGRALAGIPRQGGGQVQTAAE